MSLPKKGPGTASGNDASIALDAKEAFLEVIKACLYTRELSAGLVSETVEIGANRSDPGVRVRYLVAQIVQRILDPLQVLENNVFGHSGGSLQIKKVSKKGVEPFLPA